MLRVFIKKNADKINDYATFVIATCIAVTLGFPIVAIITGVQEAAIEMSIIVFVIGPALGFLTKTIEYFLNRKE